MWVWVDWNGEAIDVPDCISAVGLALGRMNDALVAADEFRKEACVYGHRLRPAELR